MSLGYHKTLFFSAYVYILLFLLVRKKWTDGMEMEPRKITYSETNFNTLANKVLSIHIGLIFPGKRE